MNGAESLVRSLVASSVEVCFTNPGTSEMHFVAALDRVEGMRCVLGLFEGVVTGAADGYYRLSDRPASTLLHLGPGLGNGLANLHNAKRARSGIINIVGDHATYHVKYDAPLTSDVAGVARPMSHWVQRTLTAEAVGADAVKAVETARSTPGSIATLILPGDAAWNEGGIVCTARAAVAPPKVSQDAVLAAARALRNGTPAALMLGGIAVRAQKLELAGRIAAKTGCRVLSEFYTARMERGAGRVVATRIPYVAEPAMALLKDFRDIVLVGAKPPVLFFAYPGKPSVLAPDTCRMTELARQDEDMHSALEALAAALDALSTPPAYVAPNTKPTVPTGAITLDGLAQLLGALIPDNAIVIDEAVSSGRGFASHTASAAKHDWLSNMGGAIGYGMPVAIGAAIAAPGRRVIALEGDGSAMYTVQSLWTMARESLDVLVIIFANRSYRILRGEFANVGAGEPGKRATDMLTLDRPDLDWLSLAKGHGVPASRATNLDELAVGMRRALATAGPQLIEVLM